MLYVVIGLILLFVILRMFAPVRYAVHASQAVPLASGVRPESRWMLAAFVRDEDGKLVDVEGKFIGHAAGASMANFGIPDGATFIANYLADEPAGAGALAHGDIVVVEGAAEFSETGLRLRMFDKILPDGEAAFLPDSFGRGPRPRPINEIVARVTYIIDNARVSNGEWVASIVNSLRQKIGIAA